MRPALRRAALLLPLLAAGCGGKVLFAELEIPELGITVPQQVFPASSIDPSNWCAPDRPDCIATELQYDIGDKVDLLDRDGTKLELRLTDLAIRLDTTAGGTDLGGVAQVALEAVAPGGDPVLLASYLRSPADPAPTSIAVEGNAEVDLAPFLQGGVVSLRIRMTFDAPTPEFTADVDAVFYLRVELDYLAAAGL